MAMDDKIIESNERNSKSGNMGKLMTSGCTANVVLITPTEIYCANAGDSRAVLKN